MKKQLFKYVNGKYIIDYKYKPLLRERKIHLDKGNRGMFLVFYRRDVLINFLEEFEIIPECVCVLKDLAYRKLFVHYTAKTEPDVVFRGGLVAKKEGFIGKGIYAIPEDDFVEEGIGEQNIRQLLAKKENSGYYGGNTIVIFEYTGPYYQCVVGQGKENIVNILTTSISDDQVLAIFDEEIKYVIEE